MLLSILYAVNHIYLYQTNRENRKYHSSRRLKLRASKKKHESNQVEIFRYTSFTPKETILFKVGIWCEICTINITLVIINHVSVIVQTRKMLCVSYKMMYLIVIFIENILNGKYLAWKPFVVLFTGYPKVKMMLLMVWNFWSSFTASIHE